MALLRGTLLREGRYEILRHLARGGFGFIYLAHDRRTDRRVVIKELLPVLAADEEIRRRFVRESRAMQRLTHPHIARVEATFQEQGTHYMVLEYLSAGSLEDVIEPDRTLGLAETMQVAIALCGALSYLHARGITHCDLNPSNVLFDAQGVPKLVDLGVAHIADDFVHRSWRTEHASSLGTIVYMTPEQLTGVRDEPRVDQYALAAMVYRMLSGHDYLPFDRSGTPLAQADNIALIQRETPRPIDGIGREINEVLLRALAKDPAARYASAAAFCQALTRAAIPYLPAADAVRLMAPSRLAVRPQTRMQGSDEWPAWTGVVLLVANAAIMAVVALLLLYAA
ncbi:MAG: serine/threonine protein kinase [Anaerolineae bacterium]|nr:serine/threonine protein kinase [Anaerolineae bacterium]